MMERQNYNYTSSYRLPWSTVNYPVCQTPHEDTAGSNSKARAVQCPPIKKIRSSSKDQKTVKLAARSVPKDGQRKSRHPCGLAAVTENSKPVASYAAGSRGHASRVGSSQTNSPASPILGCPTSAFLKDKIVGLSLTRRRLEIKGVQNQSKSASVILSAWKPATRKSYKTFYSSENGYDFVIENELIA
ncbi:hypothetical protein ElyMa_001040300 [Elysia marginata]|uniref:Uncharacterized protein n=1 Tax=Elysia marginata TaxID=1093978 RepID=A0AAV4HM65_9GAST|nr:hypothetical protein ElyMa_001040300 [Elysia marginata]